MESDIEEREGGTGTITVDGRHFGCGSRTCTFIWDMVGENQDLYDMNSVDNRDLGQHDISRDPTNRQYCLHSGKDAGTIK